MDEIDVRALLGIREPISCLSHLLAAPLFAILGYFLVARGRGSLPRMVSLAVFAGASVFLLLMSAGYHVLGSGDGRALMKQFDVAAVFVLIAGTGTPMHMILFRGIARWVPLLLVWSIAVVGIVLRTIYSDSLSSITANGIFLLMGWGGLFAFILAWRHFGLRFAMPLLLGGVAYTLGVFVLTFKWPTLWPGFVGPHEVWHVAVLAGLSLHWQFVAQFAAGVDVSHE